MHMYTHMHMHMHVHMHMLLRMVMHIRVHTSLPFEHAHAQRVTIIITIIPRRQTARTPLSQPKPARTNETLTH